MTDSTGATLTVTSRLAIFTICSNNYMPAARTFLQSARLHHPEADLFVCLADKKIDMPGLYDPDWTVIEADALSIQDFRSFAFRYDIMEMNTAVKPFMFQHLINELGYDFALYFDPDIEIFQPLEAILGPLRQGASFVLTPHLCAPVENEDEPNDMTIMRAGVYNLGFLGVGACDESRSILAWWARRLRFLCISAIEIGIFVDQKFMDLVPGFATKSHISHDTSLNVAYWNLGQRRLERADGGWTVDGRPLTFFHFSGFNARKPASLSKYAPRFDTDMPEPISGIIGDYARHLIANGHGTVPDGGYAYGFFASGARIHPFVREMFRKWHLAWGSDPFHTYEAFLHQRFVEAVPGPAGSVVTNFMKHLYDRFPSLSGRLVLTNPHHVNELIDWFQNHAERELAIDPRLIRPGAPAPVVAQVVAPRAAGPARDVTVVGYLRTASGVGEVGRQTLRTLVAGDVSVEGCDVALNVAASRDDATCEAFLVEHATAPVQIFNINADQLPQVVAHMAPRLRPDAVRINIPFWELSRYPDEWLAGLSEMDEIWAPSSFIAKALDGRIDKPVIHMPVALELAAPAPMPRSRFNLPAGRFLFFFAFDFLSFIERKNPQAAIAAFRLAFPEQGRAGLVLKCMNGAVVPDKLAAFRAELADDPDIFLIEETLSREDTLALIASTDAVISLHRSEGLGLLIAEAMLLGKPVIATDYSASRDFLSEETGYPVRYRLIPVGEGCYPFAEGQVWAEPDIDHAAELMRGLVDAPESARPRVAAALAHMRQQFCYKNIGEMQASRLRILATSMQTARVD
jgi:glycosyltransferase involved in cell wall biosynthesis